MQPKAGDVVLVPFPFTDQTGAKVRPAIVLSKKKYDEDVVVLFVTSKTKRRGQHVVSLVPDDGNGLRTKSQVICSKIATIETKLIVGGLGRLSSNELTKIKTSLSAVLGL